MSSIFNRRTVRIKAMQSLYAHYYRLGRYSNSDLENFVLHAFSEDMAAIQEVHVQLLHALLFWANLDEEHVKNTLLGNFRHLNDNTWIIKLRCSPDYNELKAKYPSFWNLNLLRIWYYDIIQRLPFFQDYRIDSDGQSDVILIKMLFSQFIFVSGGIRSYVALKVLDWSAYEENFKTYVYRFIKQFHRSIPTAFDLHISSSLQKEKNFCVELIKATLTHAVEVDDEINQASQNWDSDRIFVMDRIILQMALTEVKYLKGIPKLVAINEYVDIAKAYSTEKSYRFVNGILDVLLPGEKGLT